MVCRPYFKNVFVLAFCRQIVGGPSALHFHHGSELHTWHSFPAPIGPRLHCVQCWTSLYLARGALHFSSVQTLHQPQMSVCIICGNSSVSLCLWLSWARSLRTFGCVGWPSHFAPTVQYFAYLGSALWSKHNCTIPYPIAGCLHGDHFEEPSIATVQSQSSACHRPSASVLWLIYSLGRWSVSSHSWPVLVAHGFCEPFFPKPFVLYMSLPVADVSWHFQPYSFVCHAFTLPAPSLPHCWHLPLLNHLICCCLFASILHWLPKEKPYACAFASTLHLFSLSTQLWLALPTNLVKTHRHFKVHCQWRGSVLGCCASNLLANFVPRTWLQCAYMTGPGSDTHVRFLKCSDLILVSILYSASFWYFFIGVPYSTSQLLLHSLLRSRHCKWSRVLAFHRKPSWFSSSICWCITLYSLCISLPRLPMASSFSCSSISPTPHALIVLLLSRHLAFLLARNFLSSTYTLVITSRCIEKTALTASCITSRKNTTLNLPPSIVVYDCAGVAAQPSNTNLPLVRKIATQNAQQLGTSCSFSSFTRVSTPLAQTPFCRSMSSVAAPGFFGPSGSFGSNSHKASHLAPPASFTGASHSTGFCFPVFHDICSHPVPPVELCG